MTRKFTMRAAALLVLAAAAGCESPSGPRFPNERRDDPDKPPEPGGSSYVQPAAAPLFA